MELGDCDVCTREIRKEKAVLLVRKKQGFPLCISRYSFRGQRSRKWSRIRITIKGRD